MKPGNVALRRGAEKLLVLAIEVGWVLIPDIESGACGIQPFADVAFHQRARVAEPDHTRGPRILMIVSEIDSPYPVMPGSFRFRMIEEMFLIQARRFDNRLLLLGQRVVAAPQQPKVLQNSLNLHRISILRQQLLPNLLFNVGICTKAFAVTSCTPAPHRGLAMSCCIG